MKTVVKMFQPRFAPLVKSAIKRQTVRRLPKRERDMPEVGDRISAREWMGDPYRSKQRPLIEGVITEVEPISIEYDYITVNTNSEPCESFAIADGFENFQEMVEWFRTNHKLPFDGILIKWEPTFE